MDLRASDVAALLGETEETIYRWAREGALPAYRVHEQYCFNRIELQEWATAHGRRLAPTIFAPVAGTPSLRTALERGGIHYDLGGRSREEVLDAAARLPGVPDRVDRAQLKELLIGRERLASTGIGEGIAIPHTRDPLVVHIDDAILLLCFLARPVDFHALDGQPVRILFMLLSPTVKQHLQMLSRLAFALHDPLLRRLLHAKAPPEAILAGLAAAERPATVAP